MTLSKDVNSVNSEDNKIQEKEYKVYKKRWLILLLYTFYSICNLLHYIQFSVIADVIVKYYKVSYTAVDWTTSINPLIYVLLGIPVTYSIDKMGLRKAVLIGVMGTCIGSWIKVGSVHPDRFYLIILGQAVVSVFQLCIIPVLPKLTATWFPYNEVSIACGLGFVGGQVGTALSFLIPPFIVVKGEAQDVEKQLYILNISYSICVTIMVPILIIFFTDTPTTPPSIARESSIKQKEVETKSFIETVKILIHIKPYVLHLIVYGINTGIAAPVQVLSNQIILNSYPDASHDVGIIGLLQTFLSLVGSIGVSIILNKTRAFKIICWTSYFLFFGTLILYMGTLELGLPFVYFASITMGIIQGAIMTYGMELVTELTYPEAESFCVGLTITSSQSFGLVFTFLFGFVFRAIGFVWAGSLMVLLAFMANVLFFFIKFDLRRKAVQDSGSNAQSKEN